MSISRSCQDMKNCGNNFWEFKNEKIKNIQENKNLIDK